CEFPNSPMTCGGRFISRRLRMRARARTHTDTNEVAPPAATSTDTRAVGGFGAGHSVRLRQPPAQHHPPDRVVLVADPVGQLMRDNTAWPVVRNQVKVAP